MLQPKILRSSIKKTNVKFQKSIHKFKNEKAIIIIVNRQ